MEENHMKTVLNILVLSLAFLLLFSNCAETESEGLPGQAESSLEDEAFWDMLLTDADISRFAQSVDVISAIVIDTVSLPCSETSAAVCTQSTLEVLISEQDLSKEITLFTMGGEIEGGFEGYSGFPLVRTGDHAIIFITYEGESRNLYRVVDGSEGYIYITESGIRGVDVSADDFLSRLREEATR